MTRPLRFLLVICSIACSFQAASSQTLVTLSDFNSFSSQATTFEGSWRGGSPAANQYVQGSGFISITPVNSGNPQDDGDVFVDDSASPLNIGNLTQVAFTLRVDTGNADPNLKVTLYDGSLKTATANFTLSSLTVGSFTTLLSPLSFTPGFNKADVEAFQISGGQAVASNNTRVSFDNLAVVPEPSSYAMLAIGALTFGFAMRKRR